MMTKSELFGIPKKGSPVSSQIRVKTPNGSGSSSSVRNYTVLDISIGNDIQWVQDTVYGNYFVINSPGLYSVLVTDYLSTGTGTMGVSKNDQIYGWGSGLMATNASGYTGFYSPLIYGVQNFPATTFTTLQVIIDCLPGDQLRVKTGADYTGEAGSCRIIKIT